MQEFSSFMVWSVITDKPLEIIFIRIISNLNRLLSIYCIKKSAIKIIAGAEDLFEVVLN